MNMVSSKVFLMSILCLAFYACSQEDIINNVETISPHSRVTWESQLKTIMQGKRAESLASQGLFLSSYKRNSGNCMIEKENLHDEALVPLYNDTSDINRFKLLTISEIREKYIPNIHQTLSNRKNFFISRHQDIEVVTLHWLYNGKKITSQCLVCDSCVVYDDILSNIRYIKKTVSKNNIELFPRIKTREEPGTSSSDNQVEYSFDTGEYQQTNWVGTICARASCHVHIVGTKDKKGDISIDYKYDRCYSSSEDGFSASSKVEYTSFITGQNGYCDFKYGVMVGNSSNLTLTWNGSGFTMPGGSHGKTGSEYVIPSRLN